jgi:hypothetical protein
MLAARIQRAKNGPTIDSGADPIKDLPFLK